MTGILGMSQYNGGICTIDKKSFWVAESTRGVERFAEHAEPRCERHEGVGKRRFVGIGREYSGSIGIEDDCEKCAGVLSLSCGNIGQKFECFGSHGDGIT